MYDTSKRVELVKARAQEKACRALRRSVYRLSFLCILLTTALAGMVLSSEGMSGSAVAGLYGSILLHNDVGGYILVGVVAFAAAVVITVLCIRYRESLKENKNSSKEVDSP